MERLVQWHMEEYMKIYSKLNTRQYRFTKGASTETDLHKLINKIERANLNSGMALGTFLDIEAAFDNVAFHRKSCPHEVSLTQYQQLDNVYDRVEIRKSGNTRQ